MKLTLHRDTKVIYVAVFLRAAATGMAGVLFGVFLAKLGFQETASGLAISLGLMGATAAAIAATLFSQCFGQKRFLITVTLFAAAGGLAVSVGNHLTWILVFGFLGMINGGGRDRGAALIIEQALLPATTDEKNRTKLFAWYNLLQDSGHAVGSLLAGLPTLFTSGAGLDEVTAYRIAFALPALFLVAIIPVYLKLSSVAPTHAPRPPVTPESKKILWKISSLFAIDSLAGGFLTSALLAYYFYDRFAAGPAIIGLLFFVARIANAVSHLGAAWLAKRIGLVNTMVFTHIPSSILLMGVPFAPTFPLAALLFILREGLVEMDAPTRQSYVMAVVKPHERTVASGVTNLVRMGAWSAAPTLAGQLMATVSHAAPIFIGGTMKIFYDLALWSAFRRHKPPEEL